MQTHTLMLFDNSKIRFESGTFITISLLDSTLQK